MANANSDDDLQATGRSRVSVLERSQPPPPPPLRLASQPQSQTDASHSNEAGRHVPRGSDQSSRAHVSPASIDPSAAAARQQQQVLQSQSPTSSNMPPSELTARLAVVARLRDLEVANQRLLAEKSSLQRQLSHVMQRIVEARYPAADLPSLSSFTESLNMEIKRKLQAVGENSATNLVKKSDRRTGQMPAGARPVVSGYAPLASCDTLDIRGSLAESNGVSLCEYSSLSDSYEEYCLRQNPVAKIRIAGLSPVALEEDELAQLCSTQGNNTHIFVVSDSTTTKPVRRQRRDSFGDCICDEGEGDEEMIVDDGEEMAPSKQQPDHGFIQFQPGLVLPDRSVKIGDSHIGTISATVMPPDPQKEMWPGDTHYLASGVMSHSTGPEDAFLPGMAAGRGDEMSVATAADTVASESSSVHLSHGRSDQSLPIGTRPLHHIDLTPVTLLPTVFRSHSSVAATSVSSCSSSNSSSVPGSPKVRLWHTAHMATSSTSSSTPSTISSSTPAASCASSTSNRSSPAREGDSRPVIQHPFIPCDRAMYQTQLNTLVLSNGGAQLHSSLPASPNHYEIACPIFGRGATRKPLTKRHQPVVPDERRQRRAEYGRHGRRSAERLPSEEPTFSEQTGIRQIQTRPSLRQTESGCQLENASSEIPGSTAIGQLGPAGLEVAQRKAETTAPPRLQITRKWLGKQLATGAAYLAASTESSTSAGVDEAAAIPRSAVSPHWRQQKNIAKEPPSRSVQVATEVPERRDQALRFEPPSRSVQVATELPGRRDQALRFEHPPGSGYRCQVTSPHAAAVSEVVPVCGTAGRSQTTRSRFCRRLISPGSEPLSSQIRRLAGRGQGEPRHWDYYQPAGRAERVSAWQVRSPQRVEPAVRIGEERDFLNAPLTLLQYCPQSISDVYCHPSITSPAGLCSLVATLDTFTCVRNRACLVQRHPSNTYVPTPITARVVFADADPGQSPTVLQLPLQQPSQEQRMSYLGQTLTQGVIVLSASSSDSGAGQLVSATLHYVATVQSNLNNAEKAGSPEAVQKHRSRDRPGPEGGRQTLERLTSTSSHEYYSPPMDSGQVEDNGLPDAAMQLTRPVICKGIELRHAESESTHVMAPPAADTQQEDIVFQSGFIAKLSGRFKVWQKSWCTLTPRGLFFYPVAVEQRQRATRCIPLVDIRAVLRAHQVTSCQRSSSFRQTHPGPDQSINSTGFDASAVVPNTQASSLGGDNEGLVGKSKPQRRKSDVVEGATAATSSPAGTATGLRARFNLLASVTARRRQKPVAAIFEVVMHAGRIYTLRSISVAEATVWVAELRCAIRRAQADLVAQSHRAQLAISGWLRRIRGGQTLRVWCRLMDVYLIYSNGPNDLYPTGYRSLAGTRLKSPGDTTEMETTPQSTRALLLPMSKSIRGVATSSGSIHRGDQITDVHGVTVQSTIEKFQSDSDTDVEFRPYTDTRARTLALWSENRDPVYLVCPSQAVFEQWRHHLSVACKAAECKAPADSSVTRVLQLWRQVVKPCFANSMFHIRQCASEPLARSTATHMASLAIQMSEMVVNLSYPPLPPALVTSQSHQDGGGLRNLLDSGSVQPRSRTRAMWMVNKYNLIRQLAVMCFDEPGLKNEFFLLLIKQATPAAFSQGIGGPAAMASALRHGLGRAAHETPKVRRNRRSLALWCGGTRAAATGEEVEEENYGLDEKQPGFSGFGELTPAPTDRTRGTSATPLAGRRPDAWRPIIAAWECLCLCITLFLPSGPVIACLEAFLGQFPRPTGGYAGHLDLSTGRLGITETIGSGPRGIEPVGLSSDSGSLGLYEELCCYAAFCADMLMRTRLRGGRQAPPSGLEVAAISLRNPYKHTLPFSLPVHLPTPAAYEVVSFDGGTMVGQLVSQLAARLGISRLIVRGDCLCAIYCRLGGSSFGLPPFCLPSSTQPVQAGNTVSREPVVRVGESRHSLPGGRLVYLEPSWKVCDVISLYEASVVGREAGQVSLEDVTVELVFRVQAVSARIIRTLDRLEHAALLSLIAHQLHADFRCGAYQVSVRGSDLLTLAGYMCRMEHFDYAELQRRQESSLVQLVHAYMPEEWLARCLTDDQSIIQLKLLLLERWNQLCDQDTSHTGSRATTAGIINVGTVTGVSEEAAAVAEIRHHEGRLLATARASLGHISHMRHLCAARFSMNMFACRVLNLPKLSPDQVVWLVPRHDRVSLVRISSGIEGDRAPDVARSMTASQLYPIHRSAAASQVICLKVVPLRNLVSFGAQKGNVYFLVFSELVASTPATRLTAAGTRGQRYQEKAQRRQAHKRKTVTLAPKHASIVTGVASGEQTAPQAQLRKLQFLLTDLCSILELNSTLCYYTGSESAVKEPVPTGRPNGHEISQYSPPHQTHRQQLPLHL